MKQAQSLGSFGALFRGVRLEEHNECRANPVVRKSLTHFRWCVAQQETQKQSSIALDCLARTPQVSKAESDKIWNVFFKVAHLGRKCMGQDKTSRYLHICMQPKLTITLERSFMNSA